MMLLFIAFCLNSWAAPLSEYPPQKISAQGVKSLRLIGVRGDLKVTARAGSHYILRVKHTSGRGGDDWHLSMDRQGHALVLEVFNTTYGGKWREQVRREHWPTFNVELIGPSRPTQVSWREGNLSFNSWRDPLDISFIKGRFKSSKGAGRVSLQLPEGRVDIADHRGDISVNGQTGDLKFARVNGALDLHWLSGTLIAEKVSGKVKVDGANLEIHNESGQGAWAVNTERGQVLFRGFSGELKAQGQETLWDLHATAPSDLEVVSGQGSVKLDWKGRPAGVFLTTQTGQIKATKLGPVTLREGSKVIESKPSERKGNVFVRTRSGDIVWR
ncbi:MAG TPA: hypothetical protein PKC28_07415 [Bdellovibrionales bacterium]|nr:hypothetical protein [Bdellovibrionales bacterium]